LRLFVKLNFAKHAEVHFIVLENGNNLWSTFRGKISQIYFTESIFFFWRVQLQQKKFDYWEY